jgi:hypothetical protein
MADLTTGQDDTAQASTIEEVRIENT